jgi:hypothetical protein
VGRDLWLNKRLSKAEVKIHYYLHVHIAIVHPNHTLVEAAIAGRLRLYFL